MDRPKPFSHVHLRRAVAPDWPGGSGRGPRRGGSGSKRRASGRGFGFEFGRWLAIFTGQLRSLNPCGVRGEDECSKRSGRLGWTVEHCGRGLFQGVSLLLHGVITSRDAGLWSGANRQAQA